MDTIEVEVHQDPIVEDPLNSDELYDEATLQNLDPESIKKLRTTEKSRLTRIGSKIINLLRKKGSRSEIKFQRKCFTEQISEVMKLHEKYLLAKNSQEPQDGVWVKQIDTQAKWLYSAIEDYLRKTSLSTPPRRTMTPVEPDTIDEETQHDPDDNNDDDQDEATEDIIISNTATVPISSDDHPDVPSTSSSSKPTSSSFPTAPLDENKNTNLKLLQHFENLQREQQQTNQKISSALEASLKSIRKFEELAQKLSEENKKIKSELSSLRSAAQPVQQAPANPSAISLNLPQPVASNLNWTFDGDTSPSTTLSNKHESTSSKSLFRLPKINLNPYDGDPKKWSEFISTFRTFVHLNNTLTIEEKMATLKISLTEDIKNGLGDSLSNAQLYTKALETLESTYGHPQIVSRAYIQSIIDLPKVNNNDFKTLLKFSQSLSGSVASLKEGGYGHELMSSGLLQLIVTKLSPELQSRWGRKIAKSHPTCLNLQDFAEWISNYVKGEMMAKHFAVKPQQSTSAASGAAKQGRHHSATKGLNQINAITVSSTTPTSEEPKAKPLTCLLCKGDHRLTDCKEFKSKSVEVRANMVKDLRACLRCLSRGHIKKDCLSKKKCGVNECALAHHPLLHGAPRIFQPQTENTVEEKKSVSALSAEDESSTTFLRTVPVTIHSNGKSIDTTALLDDGSQATVITDGLSDKLELTGPISRSPLSTFHGQDPDVKSRRVSFEVFTRDLNRSFTVKLAYTTPSINISSPNANIKSLCDTWPHLRGIDFVNTRSSSIGVIIGRDVLRIHDELDHRYPPFNVEAPDAIRTHFGWCLVGPSPSKPPNPQINAISLNQELHNQTLDTLITKFWTTESFGVRSPSTQVTMSHDDRAALKILENTIRHTGERYEVGLMLRVENAVFPDNKEPVYRQFLSTIKKCRANKAFGTAYTKMMNEWISLRHAIKVDAQQPSPRWFLPHHGVSNPNKPGKVRIVFNPSAKHRGVSLNELLYKGPDLLTSLIGVLLRFRRFPIPISGDIEKMYHQVAIPKHQQGLFSFFWKEPESPGEPEVFQMAVHIFGAVSSPTTCIFALRKTADDFGHLYPEVAGLVKTNIYVDNYLDSTETEEEAIVRRRDVTALLKCGGFNMTQWLSSSRSVLSTINATDCSKSLNPDSELLPTERTLGLLWDCQTDSFIFKTTTKIHVKTKREVLQQISSIYDPLGFLAPVVMTAKILMQDIWRSGVDWDDLLPNSLLSVWTSWASQLENLSSLKIPRCFRLKSRPVNSELHVCTDASEQAKSRVAPLRQLSIPRLELQAAVLGTRLYVSVVKELGPIATRVVFWCDSQTVLQWIHSTSCKYHSFVAHRITEILDHSTADQWRHIPGELNPADDCSREITTTHLTLQHRWFRGPDFHLHPPSSWPNTISVSEPSSLDPEVSSSRSINLIHTGGANAIASLIDTSSNLSHLKRIVAWCLRFFRNCRTTPKDRRASRFLLVPELRDALNCIIKVDQCQHFSAELNSLKHNQPIHAESRLATLTPFLDSTGIIRVGGRLQNAALSEFLKHPIVLSSSSQLAVMLISAVHTLNQHSSTERTLHALREQYHVLQPRVVINRFIRSCFACKVRSSKPVEPLMGPLPAARLTSFVYPFTNVGIDFFGPLFVTIIQRTIKRYGVIFTCLDTRAVHLEITESLDMDSFINAFSRFIDRRGLPRICYSDNVTNLVSGEQEIRRALSRWSEPVIIKKTELLKNQPIEWRFSPPASPHFGGSWERLIKSAKIALCSILRDKPVSEEVLHTAIVGAEALLNSRPLTHVSINPGDPEALTPNHFLLLRGYPHNNLGDPSTPPPHDSKKRYQQAQILITQFWNRWTREYVPNLIERRHWLRHRRNLTVGDIVLVISSNMPRGQWPIGRVTAVFPGPDGVVRSADVAVFKAKANPQNHQDPVVSTHHFRRSAHKLCLLEEDSSSSVSSETRADNVPDEEKGTA